MQKEYYARFTIRFIHFYSFVVQLLVKKIQGSKMAGVKLLYRDGDLSYFILTQKYKNEAHQILADTFCDMPACQTLLECNPKITREVAKGIWFEFVACDMDDYVTEGLSVMALGKLKPLGKYLKKNLRNITNNKSNFVSLNLTEKCSIIQYIQFYFY